MNLKPEDILKFEAVGDQQWLEKNNAFVYVKKIFDEGHTKTAIFIYDDINGIKQLTKYDENASRPRISPCGKFLAFIKKKDKKSILTVLDLNSRKTIESEEYDSIVGAPIWSNNSKRLAFIKSSKVLDDKYKGSPEPLDEKYKYDDKIKVIDDIKYRYNEKGYFGNNKNQLFITNFKNFDLTKTEKITEFNLDIISPVFSKDDTKIYFISNPHAEGKKNLISNIYCVDISTKKIELKVKGKGAISNLQISPSGELLSFFAQNDDSMDLWFDCLYVYKIGQQKELHDVNNISKSLDRVVGKIPSSGERFPSSLPKYRWKEDNKGFYVIYPEGGASVLAELDFYGNPKIIYYDPMKTVSSFDASNEEFLVTLGDAENTENIYTLKNGKIDKKIETNKWLNEHNLGKANRYKFNGDSYMQIDGWYLEPEKVEKPNKAILFIHGGPHGIYGSSFMFQAQILASNGFTVVYVNPRGSASYGFDFANMVYQDWGGADFRDIMLGLDHLIDNEIIDKDNLGVTGWSYGGYMTCWSITQTNRFKAALAGASVVDRYSMFGTSDIGYNFGFNHFGGTPWENSHKLIERSPLNYAYKIETPLLMVHGEEDYRCPIGQSEEIFTALKYLNKEVILVRYPKEPHNFKKPYHLLDRYSRLLSWFEFYIK